MTTSAQGHIIDAVLHFPSPLHVTAEVLGRTLSAEIVPGDGLSLTFPVRGEDGWLRASVPIDADLMGPEDKGWGHFHPDRDLNYVRACLIRTAVTPATPLNAAPELRAIVDEFPVWFEIFKVASRDVVFDSPPVVRGVVM